MVAAIVFEGAPRHGSASWARRSAVLRPTGPVAQAAPAAASPLANTHIATQLMGPEGVFILGSDFLMNGGVTALHFFGELASPS
jgi:hypothetical protein